MRTSPFLLSIAVCLALAACENGKPVKPTDHEKQLVRTYASLVVLNESFPTTVNPDSTRLYEHAVDSILTVNGFSKQQFQSEFQSLVESPERFQPLMQEMVTTIHQAGRSR